MSEATPFVGHQLNWDHLLSEAREGRLPSAYLFYGPPGIGKALVARAFAAYLLCLKPGPTQACGECSSCLKVAGQRHPDLLEVMPTENRKTIVVDQCREMIEGLALAPLEAKFKIVIFPETHLLAAAGWNALLKTIEEPQPGRLFVLVATSLSRVLPTIRSRCRRLAFTPPQNEESLHCLKDSGIATTTREYLVKALHLSGGSIGLAKKILDEGIPAYLQDIHRAKTFKDIHPLVEKMTKDKVDFNLLLPAYLRTLIDECPQDPTDKQIAKLDHVVQAIRDIERHVNKTFVLENLFL